MKNTIRLLQKEIKSVKRAINKQAKYLSICEETESTDPVFIAHKKANQIELAAKNAQLIELERELQIAENID